MLLWRVLSTLRFKMMGCGEPNPSKVCVGGGLDGCSGGGEWRKVADLPSTPFLTCRGTLTNAELMPGTHMVPFPHLFFLWWLLSNKGGNSSATSYSTVVS